jgi:hypothetical protein
MVYTIVYLTSFGLLSKGCFMKNFDDVWDYFYPKVVFIIFSGLIPLMVYGFFAQTAAYKKSYSQPSWHEVAMAEEKAMFERVLAKEKLKESKPVQERVEPPPPQVYTPESNDFNIPLEELLEGNHGRFL